MLKELPNHWTILAAQTRHCLEKLLLIIINFDSLAIFHDVFVPCCSTSSSISSVQHHTSSEILTAACWQQELSQCFPPWLCHTNPSAQTTLACRSKWERLEVSRRAFSFHCKGPVGWTVVSVCVCKAQLGETHLNSWAVADSATIFICGFFHWNLSLKTFWSFFPGEILTLYPCFEVSPCFFHIFLNRKGRETSFLCRSASFCSGKAQRGEGCGKILSATQPERVKWGKKCNWNQAQHLKISQRWEISDVSNLLLPVLERRVFSQTVSASFGDRIPNTQTHLPKPFLPSRKHRVCRCQ